MRCCCRRTISRSPPCSRAHCSVSTTTHLFKLAWNRKGSLLAALHAQLPDVAGELERIADAARRQTPFTFYAALLGARGVRRKILARLGHEAADALDEFLNLALDYERRETPSLQGFVAWLRDAQAEVKRDMELARDEVRVMTVHGAKGLEAPIVILADTTTPAEGFHPPRLLPLTAKDAPPGPIVWATAKFRDTGPMAAARDDGSRQRARRIPPPALCRDDAGDRPPDRVRYRHRQKGAGRVLVRTRRAARSNRFA